MKLLHLLLIVSGTTVATACGTAERPVTAEVPHADAVLVRAATAALPSQFEAGGVLRARLTSTIASRVLAPITEIRVRPGDRVRRGQVVVVLEERELQAQAERAAASLVAARQAVRAAESDAEGAEAARTLAAATHERMSALHAKRSATPQELDEAVAALRAATARVAGARAHAAGAAASVTAAEAAANGAAIAASYSTLTAPFDGLITGRATDPGTMAAPGVPLLTLEDTAAFRLEVRLDESRAGQIAVGHAARVVFDDATAGKWTEGRVAEVSRIDPGGHGFVVKIDVPPSTGLQSGVFGRAQFASAPRQALAVPASALVRRGQMTFVFAVDGEGLARLRPISVGQTSGDLVEILAGVQDGEEVVANPPASLVDGTSIRGARAAQPPSGAGDRR